jgi:transposase
MNRTANSAERVYCVDLAKNKFQLHVFSPSGQRLQCKTFSRTRFDQFFADPHCPPGVVVMGACASSHYWSRRLQRRGFQTRLVPPQFVAKQRMGNKNDGNDCDGIFAVHTDPRVRGVPPKSLEQQDLCALHRWRELLVRQRTQLLNQARGLLAERGVVGAKHRRGFDALLTHVLQAGAVDEISERLLALIGLIVEQIRDLDKRLRLIDDTLEATASSSPLAALVDTIHGVGAVTATAFAAEYAASVDRFADARQFAAGIGVTPREDSSGERRRLGGITKRGNAYLRRLLVQCAQSVVNACQRRDDAISQLARRLLERKPRNTVVVAIANRLARIIYAVMKHREPYRAHAGATA